MIGLYDCTDARSRISARCAKCMLDILIVEIDLIKQATGDRFGITVECGGCGEIDRSVMDARYLHWLIHYDKAVIMEFFDGSSFGPKYLEVRLFEKEDTPQIADIASLIWGCRDGETA